MLSYYKFRQELFGPVPARDVYGKVPPGRGHPEECPPIRAANGFGYDILANFDVTFVRRRDGTWRAEPDRVITSDFDWAPDEGGFNDPSADTEPPPSSSAQPLEQQYAWFWQRGQSLPHKITDDVFDSIKNQVKISSFLFLSTDPNELLFMTDVPNQWRPFRAWSTVIDTDWYPASYPWHAVLELDPGEKKITISRSEPICRLIPVRRETYFSRPMSAESFGEFYARSQRWLTTHGRPTTDKTTLDITRTYSKQQIRSKFVVLD